MGYCGELAVEKQVQISDTIFDFPWQLPCFGMLVFRIGANSEEEENCSELKKPGNKSGYLHGKQSNFLIQHLKSQGQWNPITKEQDETWVLSYSLLASFLFDTCQAFQSDRVIQPVLCFK